MPRRSALLLTVVSSLLSFTPARADEPAKFTRTEDVIYGRKFGTALTLDVLKPETPNGVGLVWVVSGGWFSSHEAIRPEFARPFLDRGYTVFAVVHGSQPKFTIPEILEDMHRAVRFIRHHAKDYGIDPERIGIYGGSAGGHLSLMQGAAGTAGNPDAKDPVDRESSRVQAVACFFPPTDFLNYGTEGNVVLGENTIPGFHPPFDFREYSQERNRYLPVDDPERQKEIGRAISPVTHASSDDPPTLIIHGDADTLVPIQQAQRMVEALEEAGVEAELVVREGQAHGWPTLGDDLKLFADWFDRHLRGEGEASDAN
ncbi:MAG TPA: alpha/beta hydrolase [Planctomycetaceae bacterium]